MAERYAKETAEEFSDRLSECLSGGLTSLSIALGVKSGLFEILVKHCRTPMTSQELADVAGMKERYVREWLGAMVTAHIVHLDPSSDRYHLPTNRLDTFRPGTPQNQLALATKAVPFLGEVFSDMLEVLKKDGPLGLPFDKAKSFTEFEEDATRLFYENRFYQDFIPSVPSLHEKLSRGISMLDVGCGRGAATRILATRYPNSRFVGIDIGEDNIEVAHELAGPKNLTNLTYHCLDAETMPSDWSQTFDYVFFYNVLHDVPRPDKVLAEVKRVIAKDGLMSVLEVNAHSKQIDNLNGGAEVYTISLFHCLPVSCNSPDSLGLGTAWGREAITIFLEDQGFTIKSLTDVPNAHFLCTLSPETPKDH